MSIEDERQVIYDALQAVDPWENDEDRGSEQESYVLASWVAICEFMDAAGEKWLCHFSGDATGSRGLPSWIVQGMCHDVLIREANK